MNLTRAHLLRLQMFWGLVSASHFVSHINHNIGMVLFIAFSVSVEWIGFSYFHFFLLPVVWIYTDISFNYTCKIASIIHFLFISVTQQFHPCPPCPVYTVRVSFTLHYYIPCSHLRFNFWLLAFIL